MTVLRVENLAFSYGKKQVFSDIDFQVAQGEIFCLVGPNGCGKSTLLHCLLGHVQYQRGDVLLDGVPLQGNPPRQLAATLAYVPQNHNRSFPYRVLDVVAMGKMRQGSAFSLKHRDDAQVLETLAALGIAHLAENEYTTLSGGELQMVLLARMLYQDSDIFVLDEPVAHLDVRRTQQILSVLLKVVKARGKSVIMSTHDFNHPLFFEDAGAPVKMALMEKGTISTVDTPMRLLSAGALETMYQIKSEIVTLGDSRPRHYIATWSEE